ncbi:transglycosylase domain-containing protein [Chungangia koreensis]|uniref:Transglycosylase domain-containing protein n=1 Tax=Chungangia koreensis TaxID=752657 RepID=A0ABV8X718_9LACT
MRQLFGFIATIIAIPVLFFMYKLLISELETNSELQRNMSSAVNFEAPSPPAPVVLKDSTGQVFSEDYVEWRQPLTLEKIPYLLQQLFIYSEDLRFYEHEGYDFSAIVRAFLVNSSSDGIEQGGSTITQQLVRMKYLSAEQSYERKVTELLYARELEKQFEKEEILEMYMNEMYFGNLVYGVGAASTYYFNKPLSELNGAELAFIASIPNNPSLYDPLKNFDRTKERQERLLDILVRETVITQEQAEDFKEMPITLNVKEKKNLYPSYSTFVLQEFKELVGESEGFTERLSKATDPIVRDRIQSEFDKRLSDLQASGIVIDTSLNPTKQKMIELNMSSRLRTNELQAGGAVIDNKNREIIAVYGGKGYKKYDFNRAFQAVRQPGSAIKPLLVYAPLFESVSYVPDSIVDGSQICIGNYCPNNYGGAVYGNVSIRDAFKHSYNSVAVRMFQKVGIDQAFSYLEPFNFNHITEKDHTYPAALGGFESGMTVLEMADAYTSFIDGLYKPVRAIRSVKNTEGQVLYQWNEEKHSVWKPKTVNMIRELLSEVVESGTGRGISTNSSYIGAKTGTTDNYHDYWIAGMNDQYTAAVWMGYDRPRNMKHLQSDKIQHDLFSILIEK